MEWLAQNWVWILFFVGMIAMHMFGHGGHGGHSGGRADTKPKRKNSEQRSSEPGPEHKH